MTDAPSSSIDSEARKILRKWARLQAYVYLRPLDYRFYNPTADFAVHWKVTVEYRGIGYQQHVGEGMSLSEVIKKLDTEIRIPKPSLPPRQSPPRPTETRRIVTKMSDEQVKIRKNPGRIKVSKKFVEDAEGDAPVLIRRKKKPARANRQR